ncbi:MAG: AEC family transporter [Pseudomonadota bacterium]
MLATIFSIAPIFVLIILGYGLRRGGIPSIDFWNLNDKLVYWVLFPALLFHTMATVELSGDLLGKFAITVYAGFAAALIFSFFVGRFCKLPRPTWTSVMQGCARHNTFIALAVAERVFGAEGLVLAALITAILIPVTNLSIVPLMITLLQGAGRNKLFKVIVREVGRNPLLIAVALGIGANTAGVSDIPVLFDVAKVLGAAALPIVLLCVGANLRVRKMSAAIVPTLISMMGKMIIFPGVIAIFALATGLAPLPTLIAMVFGAVPSSANAYTLARQIGGDAPTMAAIVTMQTAVSFFTLPVTLMLVQRWVS